MPDATQAILAAFNAALRALTAEEIMALTKAPYAALRDDV